MIGRLINVIVLVAALAAGCGGEEAASCTVEDNGDGSATIRCPDGTSTTIGPDQDTSCTIDDNGDGTSTITCDDGTTVVVGEDKSCTIAENDDGSSTITCDDGTTVVVDGDDESCTVADNGDGTATISCDDGSMVTVGDDDSCTIEDNGNGTSTIVCDDGTMVVVGGDSTCTIDHHDDGTATIRCDDGTNVTVTSLAIVFYESALQTGGNLGNRAATAAICEAAQGSLECESGVQALLAYTGDDLASMPANYGIPENAPIQSATGIRIADNWADLIDLGGITTSLFDAGVSSTQRVVYAGSNRDGTTSADNCDDWTVADQTADFDAIAPQEDQLSWISPPGGPYGCGFDTRLICVCY